MSQLLVITFEQRETAGQAAARLKAVQSAHGLDLADMAVVEKDADGKVHVHHGLDKVTAGGAVGGGFLGLLLGLVFFPVAGLLIGAAAGGSHRPLAAPQRRQEARRGRHRGPGPGHLRALRLGSGHLSAVVGALEPFRGKVYQTTLDPEAEAQIQAALDRGASPSS